MNSKIPDVIQTIIKSECKPTHPKNTNDKAPEKSMLQTEGVSAERYIYIYIYVYVYPYIATCAQLSSC